MHNRILNAVFSLPGASLAVGAAGFLSAIVTMFVDVNSQISIKWVLLLLLLSISFALVLLKVIFDLSIENKIMPPFEIPIKSIEPDRLFIIRRNENFLNSIIVGCYSQLDDIDRLAYIAIVYLVQDKVIQIKIHADLGVLQKFPMTTDELKNIVIRPVIPVSALQNYAFQGENV